MRKINCFLIDKIFNNKFKYNNKNIMIMKLSLLKEK